MDGEGGVRKGGATKKRHIHTFVWCAGPATATATATVVAAATADCSAHAHAHARAGHALLQLHPPSIWRPVSSSAFKGSTLHQDPLLGQAPLARVARCEWALTAVSAAVGVE